jgi:hypothetical protein
MKLNSNVGGVQVSSNAFVRESSTSLSELATANNYLAVLLPPSDYSMYLQAWKNLTRRHEGNDRGGRSNMTARPSEETSREAELGETRHSTEAFHREASTAPIIRRRIEPALPLDPIHQPLEAFARLSIKDSEHSERSLTEKSHASSRATSVLSTQVDHLSDASRMRSPAMEIELQHARREIDSLRKAVKNHEKQEHEHVAQMSQAEHEKRGLQTCVEELKQQIFSMQPLEYATDGKLSQQYGFLCAAIMDWADIQFRDVENPPACAPHLRPHSAEARLVGRHIEDADLWPTICRYPAAGAVMTAHFLYSHLYETVLQEEVWFIGLNKDHEYFISGIEWALSNLQPPRGRFGAPNASIITN